MALIKCPECGKEISDKSKACIHCGYPLEYQQKETKKYRLILLKTSDADRLKCTLVIRKINPSISLTDALSVVDNTPNVVVDGISYDDALDLKRDFAIAGAIAEFKESDGKEETFDNIQQQELQLFCPRCKSTQIITGTRGFSFVTGFLGSSQTVNRCGKCGYKWKPKM